MKKRFSNPGLIISSLILGGCMIIAPCIISPVNPFPRIFAPYFKATLDKDSVKRQFVSGMIEDLQREPKADIASKSQLQGISVNSISSGTYGSMRGIKIEYSLSYSPSAKYSYTCWAIRQSGGDYLAFAPYGMKWLSISNRVRQVQSARIKIT